MFINIEFVNGTNVSIEIQAYFHGVSGVHCYLLNNYKWIHLKEIFVSHIVATNYKMY